MLLKERGEGRETAECGMWAIAIVLLQEEWQGCEAFCVAAIEADVRPLTLERLVEGLCFAVRLRPVGSRALEPHAEGGRDRCHRVRAIVAAVVGEDALDAHAECLEGGERSFQEGGGGVPSLVRQRLCVGVAAEVIDGDVDEVVPQATADVPGGARVPEARGEALPATVWNAAE